MSCAMAQSLVFHCGGPGLILNQSICDLWWTKWHWARISLSTSILLPAISFHQCSTLISIYMLLLPGQMGAVLEPLKSNILSEIRNNG